MQATTNTTRGRLGSPFFKRLGAAFVKLALLVLTIELSAWVCLWLLAKNGLTYAPLASTLSDMQKDTIRSRIRMFRASGDFRGQDPVLGWTVSRATFYENVRINGQGIRSDVEYLATPTPDIVRVSAFGDSFTFGDEVSNNDTWEQQANRRDPRFEILNFGVSADGLDQAYLRYLKDGASFRSDIVVIGFMSENIFRNVNVFRPFYSPAYATNLFTKPRFLLEGGRLVLLDNPLRTVGDYEDLIRRDKEILEIIGKHDYFYQRGYGIGTLDFLASTRLLKIATAVARNSFDGVLKPVVVNHIKPDVVYNNRSEAFLVTVKTFEAFYRRAILNGSLPVVMIYPDADDLDRFRASGAKRYEPLLAVLRANDIRYLDILDAFDQYDHNFKVEGLTVGKFGHFSPLGNKIAADYLLNYLNSQRFSDKARVSKAIRQEVERGGDWRRGTEQ